MERDFEFTFKFVVDSNEHYLVHTLKIFRNRPMFGIFNHSEFVDLIWRSEDTIKRAFRSNVLLLTMSSNRHRSTAPQLCTQYVRTTYPSSVMSLTHQTDMPPCSKTRRLEDFRIYLHLFLSGNRKDDIPAVILGVRIRFQFCPIRLPLRCKDLRCVCACRRWQNNHSRVAIL